MLTARVVPRGGTVLRAVLATVEIMLGTVAAHTWAGGALPSAAWVAVVSALVLVGSLLVGRGRVPAPVVVAVLAGLQLLLHCWLVALTPAAHHMAGTENPATLELTGPMLLAHAAAAVLTAVVWRVRRRAVDVLLAWSDTTVVVTPRLRSLAATPSTAAPVVRGLVGVAPRRGPPALLARA